MATDGKEEAVRERQQKVTFTIEGRFVEPATKSQVDQMVQDFFELSNHGWSELGNLCVDKVTTEFDGEYRPEPPDEDDADA